MEKYKSEIKESIHSAASGLYRVGAMSDEEMREFDEACLVKPAAPVPRISTQKPAALRRRVAPN